MFVSKYKSIMKKTYKGDNEKGQHQKDIVGTVALVVSPSAEQFGGAAMRRQNWVVKGLWPSAIGKKVQNGAGEFVL